MKNVKEITKKKTLGIFNNSIDIKAFDEVKNKLIIYTFTSFTSRNIAYKRIKMVWRAYLRANPTNTTEVNGSTGILQSDSDSDSSQEEKEINLNSINRSSISEISAPLDQDDVKEEVYFPAIDPSRIFECCKIELKISTVEVFEKFIKDDSEMSWKKFYEEAMGHTNVSVTEWKEIEPGTFIRDLNFLIKVNDVPFISQTRVHKAQKLKKEESGKFIFSGSSTSLDVPYSSYFQIEDTWEFIPYGTSKCILRTTACVNFTKSTMFKSKIETKTKEKFKAEVDKWFEYINSKNISFENYIPVKIKSVKEELLHHGLEKSLNSDPSGINKRRYFDYLKNKFEQSGILGFYSCTKINFWLMVFLTILVILIIKLLISIKGFQTSINELEKQISELKNLLTLISYTNKSHKVDQ
jgi:hypothetical protein